MERRVANFDASVFDRLENYTMALVHANTLWLAIADSQDCLPDLCEEAIELRRRFRLVTSLLIAHDLFGAEVLKDCTWSHGTKQVATDLQQLATTLSENWPKIARKCALRAEELAHANDLATRILRLIAIREQTTTPVAAAADIRARAFTLVIDTYEELRRAVSYLRWYEGDADTIAPSLYGRRKYKGATDLPRPVAASARSAATATAASMTAPASPFVH